MSNRAVDLVVTDLDGTLSDSHERVHPRSAAAVKEIEAAGIPVLIATGRRRYTAGLVLDGASLSCPAVLLDGSLGVDLGDSGRVFHLASFTTDAAAAVLAAFQKAGVEPCVFVDDPDADFLVGEHPSTHPGHLARNAALTRTVDLAATVRSQPVLAFAVIGRPGAELARVVDALAADGYAPSLDGTRPAGSSSLVPDRIYGGCTLQVRPAGVSKWSGVLAFCERRGLDPGRVLAVGDANNDLELLAAAKIACTVEDAAPAARALADHVLGPPERGGWAGVLDLV